MEATVHILILAAGASSRMRGADKLLQEVTGGLPLLRHVAEAALATGAPVTVTLPTGAEARRAALLGLPIRIIEVPDAALGMSRSLVTGIGSLEPVADVQDGVMILPADMPGFTPAALSGLIARFQDDPGRILRGGTSDGQAGHPAIFPRDLWPALCAVTGDEGGRSVLQANRDRVRVIPLPGRMALNDLDTPEDWAAWRAGGP
ncbi:MAG: NTP transferase domain-containing protein [Tabrizicola sp.]